MKNLCRIAALLTLAISPSLAGTLYFDFNQNFVTPNASLFLFGAANQTANVSTLSGFNQPVTLNSQGFFSLAIASSFQQSGIGIRNTGFEISSANPIAGYFVNRASASTDMTYLLDSNALGTNYVVASQGVGFGEGSQVAIHAITNGTNVTFTPKGGAPINVTLNAGETYKYAGGATDLTGSRIVASSKVAVFSGHACAQVPVGTTFCDTLLEQMIPTSGLSTNYYLSASKGADIASGASDLVRVVAAAANTQVTLNGSVVATLANIGDVHEFNLAAGTGARIQTSQGALIAQYLRGGVGALTDPAMSVVPGSDTWLKEYRLATPSGLSAFDINYASVVIETSILSSLKLDNVVVNTSGFSAIGSTGYSRGIVDLPLGLFNLTATNPFLVMLGGGSNADSYFTYGGSTFAPGISPPVDTSVPEPSTYAMLGIGLAGLALIGRRKRA